MLPFATRTVTRLRAPLRDDGRGNQIPDWPHAVAENIAGCSVQPGGTSENLKNRHTVEVAYSIIMPADTDILATDHVRIDGADFAVVGEPARWTSGVLDHVQFEVRKWDG